MTQSISRHSRRLIFFSTFLALFQLISALRALQIPADLAAQINLSLPLEFVVSGFWALLFALFTFKLIRLDVHAQHHTFWAIIGFVIYSAVRLLLFAQAHYDRQRLPFLFIIIAIISLMMVAHLLRRSINGDNR